jgi:hypothetical protein
LIRKFFPLDKNYLLEGAQLRLQDTLLASLIEKVKDHYFLRFNPLRLSDFMSESIQKYKFKNLDSLGTFYQTLAGVYRYKFGDSQLEFLWDGNDHSAQYEAEWTAFFDQCTNEFCKQDLFIVAVLDLTVFLPKKNQAQLAENRMNHFILQHFEVKIHKQRGIVPMKVA